ncbi:MAG: D-glycero-beta-D-manno-heptose 1,7-bisphosphate 7-phosphatase [Candidatus Aminicenantes bacterium]|nr:D-glycero-beta-D-manno-heptose 1,7-bisphosphate 7-phosphatase [Candidatus Aminicenantes bacterium]
MPKAAVFLDRDGVINRDRSDYVKSWEEFEFLPGVLEAFRVLALGLHQVVVISNQSCIGRGLVGRAMVDEIHACMTEAVRRSGGRIDAVYYCPHRPDEDCPCRKPRPGLILKAARELDIDLAASWLVGDDLRDLETAKAAGVRPVLVRTGHGRDLPETRLARVSYPFDVFEDLFEAVTRLGEGRVSSRS